MKRIKTQGFQWLMHHPIVGIVGLVGSMASIAGLIHIFHPLDQNEQPKLVTAKPTSNVLTDKSDAAQERKKTETSPEILTKHSIAEQKEGNSSTICEEPPDSAIKPKPAKANLKTSSERKLLVSQAIQEAQWFIYADETSVKHISSPQKRKLLTKDGCPPGFPKQSLGKKIWLWKPMVGQSIEIKTADGGLEELRIESGFPNVRATDYLHEHLLYFRWEAAKTQFKKLPYTSFRKAQVEHEKKRLQSVLANFLNQRVPGANLSPNEIYVDWQIRGDDESAIKFVRRWIRNGLTIDIQEKN